MSHVKTDKLSARTASGTVELGVSGETISIPSGVTISNSGTASGFGGANTPAFVGDRITSDQSASASTWTKVQLNSISIDTDSAWDSGNYRWTVPSGEGGKYFIIGAIRFLNASGDLNKRYVAIYKNGSNLAQTLAEDPGTGNCYRDNPTRATVAELVAGDYIELYGHYTSGSASVFETVGTYLNIFKLVE